MQIGQWVKREGAFRRHRSDPEKWVGPRWHLVESVVADDAVTRCGRRMDRWNRGHEGRKGEMSPLQVSEVMPLTRAIGQPQLCRQCDNAAPLMASITGRHEDDPSTSPVDPT